MRLCCFLGLPRRWRVPILFHAVPRNTPAAVRPRRAWIPRRCGREGVVMEGGGLALVDAGPLACPLYTRRSGWHGRRWKVLGKCIYFRASYRRCSGLRPAIWWVAHEPYRWTDAAGASKVSIASLQHKIHSRNLTWDIITTPGDVWMRYRGNGS